MKLYSDQTHLPSVGIFLLPPGAILLGIAIGALAYVISDFFYLLVIFPLVIGFVAMLGFGKLVNRLKVRHSIGSAFWGMVTGLCVAIGFYGVPYLVLRNNVTDYYQQTYQVDAKTASIGFDSVLRDITGSGGFFGYLKLHSSKGAEYSQYLMVNSVPIKMFSLKLQATGAWLYMLLEMLLYCVPCALSGYLVGKREYSISADDWYHLPPTRLGSVHLEHKETLLSGLKLNDLTGISQIMLPDGEIKHPLLEINTQHSNNKKGDILLTVIQTHRKNETVVVRKVLNRWEVPEIEYKTLMDMINRKFSQAAYSENTAG